MKLSGRKRMLWILLSLLALGLLAALALWFAVQRNGPGVVDAIDRLFGSNDTQLIERVSTGPSPAQKLLVFGPQHAQAAPLPVILFFHGGGWNSGDPDDYGFVARTFVAEGFIVVLGGYRLHPEARFPAMLEDSAKAFAWTRENIARFGGDPARITLVGHSAGAYNAAMIALDRQWLERAGLERAGLGRTGHDPGEIAGFVGLAGPYDFFPFTSTSAKLSFGHVENAAQVTQPIAFAHSDAPPMLLLTGTADVTVRPRNSRVLAARIASLGGKIELREFDGMGHEGILLATARPWRRNPQIVDAVARFAKSARSAAPASVPVQPRGR